MIGEEQKFIFVRLSVLREYLRRDLQMPNLPFPYDFERAIDDWVNLLLHLAVFHLLHLAVFHLRHLAPSTLPPAPYFPFTRSSCASSWATTSFPTCPVWKSGRTPSTDWSVNYVACSWHLALCTGLCTVVYSGTEGGISHCFTQSPPPGDPVQEVCLQDWRLPH